MGGRRYKPVTRTVQEIAAGRRPDTVQEIRARLLEVLNDHILGTGQPYDDARTALDALVTEIEELHDTFKAQLRAGTADLRAKIEEQAKEIERLREAAQDARDMARSPGFASASGEYRDALDAIADALDAALNVEAPDA